MKNVRNVKKNLKKTKIFLSKVWNCYVCRFHKWTCASFDGIRPTQKQLEDGVEGFKDYAKMYCKRCGTESELSKRWKNEWQG